MNPSPGATFAEAIMFPVAMKVGAVSRAELKAFVDEAHRLAGERVGQGDVGEAGEGQARQRGVVGEVGRVTTDQLRARGGARHHRGGGREEHAGVGVPVEVGEAEGAPRRGHGEAQAQVVVEHDELVAQAHAKRLDVEQGAVKGPAEPGVGRDARVGDRGAQAGRVELEGDRIKRVRVAAVELEVSAARVVAEHAKVRGRRDRAHARHRRRET